MFSIFCTEDIVRGSNSLGTNNTINNITEVILRNKVKEMSDKFLLPLSKCIETLKSSIKETNNHLSKY